jgi:hypothetical protein
VSGAVGSPRGPDSCCAFVPLRVDLFGNWSDHLDFVASHPSRVVNSAIALSPTELPVWAKVGRLIDPVIRYKSVDRGIDKILSLEDLWSTPVLNVLTERYSVSTASDLRMQLTREGGLCVETFSPVPFRSGLGTSAALSIAVLVALRRLAGETCGDRSGLARDAYDFEARVTGCGWQDHYACSHGEPLLVRRDGPHEPPEATPLSGRLGQILERHGLIVFLSPDEHPPVRWDVQGHMDELLAMDQIVAEYLAHSDTLSLSTLQSYLTASSALSSPFVPASFAQKLEALMSDLRPLDCAGSIVGLGPGALLLTAERSRLREELVQRGLSPLDIFEPRSGATLC